MAASSSRARSKTMNVTQEVVTDLLPIYFSGEASGATKIFVEDYFRQDPDFERLAHPSRPAQKRRNATWRASVGDCGGVSGCSRGACSSQSSHCHTILPSPTDTSPRCRYATPFGTRRFTGVWRLPS